MRKLLLLAVIAVAAFSSGCSSSNDPAPNNNPAQSPFNTPNNDPEATHH